MGDFHLYTAYHTISGRQYFPKGRRTVSSCNTADYKTISKPGFENPIVISTWPKPGDVNRYLYAKSMEKDNEFSQ